MNKAFIQKNREYQEKILGMSEFRKLTTGQSIILMCTLGTLLGTAMAYGF